MRGITAEPNGRMERPWTGVHRGRSARAAGAALDRGGGGPHPSVRPKRVYQLPIPQIRISEHTIRWSRADLVAWLALARGEEFMRQILLAMGIAVAGCASNPNVDGHGPGRPLEDTTHIPGDAAEPSDTPPRVRDSVMDSTSVWR